MQLALAPMEGLVDDILRDVLTRVGGIDWCVTEFIRVNDGLLPAHVYYRLAPELREGARTRAGTPMHVQLLGSDPQRLGENAAFACTLGAPVIDLNFGCPAKTVNKSRGGAVLLKEPELMQRIVCEVRRAVPAHIPVTAKMRLGYESPDAALDCVRALAEGGAARIVVHARTKTDGYRPPAYWEQIPALQAEVSVPVLANGEIWNVSDWRRCRELSGASGFMLGRGLVACPDLALQIRAAALGHAFSPLQWAQLLPLVQEFWRQARHKLDPAKLELHEARRFGRFIVHDLPEFTRLQHQLTELVSQAAGEAVEPSYSFLSLYTKMGVCEPHLDAPSAKWTLDICIDQSEPWPIHLSQIIPWPEAFADLEDDWQASIKADPQLNFSTEVLMPGDAILFSGSSQWHYRDPLPQGEGKRFCDLLFLHYIPKGAGEIVRPDKWAKHFGIPELAQSTRVRAAQ